MTAKELADLLKGIGDAELGDQTVVVQDALGFQNHIQGVFLTVDAYTEEPVFAITFGDD
jgi:hypothetical protein